MSEFGSVTKRRGSTVPYGLAMSRRAVHNGETQTPLGRCSRSGVRLGLCAPGTACAPHRRLPCARRTQSTAGPRLSYHGFSRRRSLQQLLNSFCMSFLQSVWLIGRFCAFDDNPFLGRDHFDLLPLLSNLCSSPWSFSPRPFLCLSAHRRPRSSGSLILRGSWLGVTGDFSHLACRGAPGLLHLG